ncbi:MAG: D-alanine--D-alanine ligase [Flavobacteriales bacterium]|nr:D-alanine--D-alanine ligase [Flavobacteriales bacterium]
MRVGIFFGGGSREREVSFAGGRTVYDNLDKSLFDPIPVFIDEFGNFLELDWAYVYRGTIRDFYPPASYLDVEGDVFQIYGESLGLSRDDQHKMLHALGKVIPPDELASHMDMAFLALHGTHGEDGTIQGLLEWYGIPYTGSGILPSSFGVNKAIQKTWMESAGFRVPHFVHFHRTEWDEDPGSIYEHILSKVGFPLVVKAANQGSSIGISILREANPEAFERAVDLAFFRRKLNREAWNAMDKEAFIRNLTDLRSDLGFPIRVDSERVLHPALLQQVLEDRFEQTNEVVLESERSENEIVIEQMLEGKEFSCIVLAVPGEFPVALPPTEIVKKKDLFDYRSKYLPGLSRKVTPIEIPEEHIERIRQECVRLFDFFRFQVYARIDGFISANGEIFLNDPNTTSGMMPSSFFFHQAAEIGLNPSQFLTFILDNSLMTRSHYNAGMYRAVELRQRLADLMSQRDSTLNKRKRVAVILGGYSSERHISVESGRNIYEKLSSSVEFEPFPVFLTGNDDRHELYALPINILLKDNADDIKNKVENFHEVPILRKIREQARTITQHYNPRESLMVPTPISYEELGEMADLVFIALHGRPGEDGALQRRLDALGIPYNGSGVESSELTINKFRTNNVLRDAGFQVAENLLIERTAWDTNQANCIERVHGIGYPVIAKPTDEGCSSAVLKIRSDSELIAYAQLTYREQDAIDPALAAILKIDIHDEFPRKQDFLVERFVDRAGSQKFLEITGGLLTHHESDGSIRYEVFEPSEALSEGEVLTLAEKFLAGEGQNITPARFNNDPQINASVSRQVREVLERVARTLDVRGYCRIDAFVRIMENNEVEVIIIEVNSLPGMTPATCIYHQASINGYKPFDFIKAILQFSEEDRPLNRHEKTA